MIWLISGSRFAPEREVKAILDTMADAGWLYIGFARPLAIDESWAAFKLQDGDYIDMGSWKEGPGGEDAN